MTYWDTLKKTAAKIQSNGHEVLELARIARTTKLGISRGAMPKKKTLAKIEAALTIIGWDGTYRQAG